MTSRSAPFRDPNFKLAVIHALHELGEFQSFFTAIGVDDKYGPDGPYFAKAKGNAYFGAHPEVLALFLDLDITAEQLARVRKLKPDGGDETYLRIAPNWDGEDGLFSLKGLADVALLPNLEEIESFHDEPVSDCSALLACPKLRRVVDAGRFTDWKTLEALRSRGVAVPEPPRPPRPPRPEPSRPQRPSLGPFDPNKPRALVLELRELGKGFPKPWAFNLSKRLQQRTFYFYDVKFENKAKLPKEEEEDYPEAERAPGYELCAKILDALAAKNAGWFLFDASIGSIEALYGWHNSASREELAEAFKASGFEVYSLAFVYEHR